MKKAAKAKQSESMLPTWNPAVSQSMNVVPPNRCSECNNTTPGPASIRALMHHKRDRKKRNSLELKSSSATLRSQHRQPES